METARSQGVGAAWRGLVLWVVVVTGCAEDDRLPPLSRKAQEQAREREHKRERCQTFAKYRHAQLDAQLNGTLADVEEVGRSPGPKAPMRSDLSDSMRRLADRCMEWPGLLLAECIGEDGSVIAECEDRIQLAMGDAAPKVPDTGPAVAWRVEARDVVKHHVVLPGGTVLAVLKHKAGMVAIRDGAELWHMPGNFVPARGTGPSGPVLVDLPHSPSAWLVATTTTVVAFDITTGKPIWTFSLPEGPVGEPDALGNYFDAWFVGDAVSTSAGVVIGDSQGRVFALAPERCAKKKQKGCLEQQADLDGEVAHLLLDERERRYAWGHGDLDVLDSRGTLLAQMRGGPWDFTNVAIRGEHLVVAVAGEIVEMDMAHCAKKTPFGPAGLIPTEGGPPAGCRRWRVQVDDLEPHTMVVLDSGLVVVNAYMHSVGVLDGRVHWNVPTGALGPFVTDGTRIFGASAGRQPGHRPAFFELSPADGKERWRTSFGGDFVAERIALTDGWLVAQDAKTVVALQVPAAPR